LLPKFISHLQIMLDGVIKIQIALIANGLMVQIHDWESFRTFQLIAVNVIKNLPLMNVKNFFPKKKNTFVHVHVQIAEYLQTKLILLEVDPVLQRLKYYGKMPTIEK